jgi:hypothetical protein
MENASLASPSILTHFGNPDWRDVKSDKTTYDTNPARMCARRGGQLPVIRTKAELSDMLVLLHYSELFQAPRPCRVMLGMRRTDMSFPNLYRHMWTGGDKSILYNLLLKNVAFKYVIFGNSYPYAPHESDDCVQFLPKMYSDSNF